MTKLVKCNIDVGIERVRHRINHITCVYGGISKNIEERYQQHVRENDPPNSRNMEYYLLYSLTIKDAERDKELLKHAENYLINELDRIFGVRCENDRTVRGVVKQKGGYNTDCKVGDVYQIYIMYETILY
jgi:hypothetical protein